VRFIGSLLTAFLVAPLLSAAAQTDVVRGRIIGPDSAPVPRATVTVTSIRGNVSRSARTDDEGRYTIAFPGDDGDYFVSVAALGFAARRFEIKRVGDEPVLVGNVKLAFLPRELDAVRVDATRQRVSRTALPLDVSGTDRKADASAVSADPFADLAALAASIPGVQLIPGGDGTPNGFSVFGLSADQNATTLNGMAFGGSALPRDAAVSVSLVTTPYDVSRGNFSGGQLTLRTDPGSNYISRLGGVNLDARTLQWTDRAARALGQQYGNVSVGGRVTGPIQFDRSFYSIAYQAGRRWSDYQTLLNTSSSGLRAAGIAPDSVSRLLSTLVTGAVPTAISEVPAVRLTDNASVFGSIDYAPSATSGQAFNLTFTGAWVRQNPSQSAVTQTPSRGGERASWYGGAQLHQSGYYGIGVLSETSVGLSRFRVDGSPFADLPSAVVRVTSVFPDGTTGVEPVAFGGTADYATTLTTTTAQVMNQLSWFTADNAHRLKLTTELRRDHATQDVTMNRLGTFAFNSLSELAANQPSMFIRTIGSRPRAESQDALSLSLGDVYSPSRTMQLQYGVRADANRFETTPERNDQVERAFGVRNDHVPNTLALSPRVGFAWAYGAAPRAGALDGTARDARASVRGGVGVFRNAYAASQIGPAVDNTGLSGGAQQVICVGTATPRPDWSAYEAGEQNVPVRCADGSLTSGFASSSPNVTLVAPDFAAPASVRSNVQWNGLALGNRFATSVDVTYSLNLDQPSVADLNFRPERQFSLADDGRPVYASAAGIDPRSGSIAAGEARVAPAFARVAELRSDMRSETKQLTLQLRPAAYNSGFAWSVAYVYANTRERYRGFTSTSADPRAVAWSRSPLDSRHQFVYTLSYNVADVVRLNWYGTVRSGTPYTPIVASDINGDGFVNDRAFIPDPSRTTDSELAAGMRGLLATGSGSARACLQGELGRIADRSSCQGPWTAAATLTLLVNPLTVRLPQRANLAFQISNPLSAADVLLHGEAKLHGWGQTAAPASQLLFVRGFDAATQRYRYEVNQRFGATAVTQTATRAPITLTAMLRFDLGPTRERQTLTTMLDRGRVLPGQKLPEPIIKAAYGTGAIVNPLSLLLRDADSLSLTPRQGDSIAVLNRSYMVTLDSIWTPVAKYLAALPERYEQRDAYRRYRTAREANVDALIALAPTIKSLLTRAQVRALSPTLTPYLDTRYLASIRSGTAGAGLGALLPNGMPLPVGATDAASAVIMMHGGTP
jgi:Carboxypeptidase regulatory-like domain